MASGSARLTEIRALQAVVSVLSLMPLSVGTAGIFLGPSFLHTDAPWPIDLDSHFRFLSGVFLGGGIAFLSCVPSIETKGSRFRLLAGCVFLGGIARLFSLAIAGVPSLGHVTGLVMELVVVPLLVLWQRRVAGAGSHDEVPT